MIVTFYCVYLLYACVCYWCLRWLIWLWCCMLFGFVLLWLCADRFPLLQLFDCYVRFFSVFWMIVLLVITVVFDCLIKLFSCWLVLVWYLICCWMCLFYCVFVVFVCWIVVWLLLMLRCWIVVLLGLMLMLLNWLLDVWILLLTCFRFVLDCCFGCLFVGFGWLDDCLLVFWLCLCGILFLVNLLAIIVLFVSCVYCYNLFICWLLWVSCLYCDVVLFVFLLFVYDSCTGVWLDCVWVLLIVLVWGFWFNSVAYLSWFFVLYIICLCWFFCLLRLLLGFVLFSLLCIGYGTWF